MPENFIGRAPELLQAQSQAQKPAEAAAEPAAPAGQPATPPVLETPPPISQPEVPPVVQPETPPVVTPPANDKVQALELFPDSDVKALAESQGVDTTPFDRAKVIAALAAKGITHATK